MKMYAILFLLLFVSACSTSQTGLLKVQLTDAPAQNVEKAEVTISNIEVHLGDGNESGWMTVVNESQTYDLITLKNTSVLLGSEQLPVGRYTQVRLNVEKAVVTIEGQQYDLTVPSDKLKLVSGFDIEENKTTTITLDFDAAESIVEKGKGEYSLKPTIKLLSE